MPGSRCAADSAAPPCFKDSCWPIVPSQHLNRKPPFAQWKNNQTPINDEGVCHGIQPTREPWNKRKLVGRKRPLKLAPDTEAVLSVNANGTRVRYANNTEPGSSGSPVFDINWNLVALHHHCTSQDLVAMRNVAHAQIHEIAAAQLALDRQVEHS